MYRCQHIPLPRLWFFALLVLQSRKIYTVGAQGVFCNVQAKASWLNLEHPKLSSVRHSDYMPQSTLPAFNSNAIEMSLHKILGLAKRFLYFNSKYCWQRLIRVATHLYFPHFTGFFELHTLIPCTKLCFEDVWRHIDEVLKKTMHTKSASPRNVNQLLFR